MCSQLLPDTLKNVLHIKINILTLCEYNLPTVLYWFKEKKTDIPKHILKLYHKTGTMMYFHKL